MGPRLPPTRSQKARRIRRERRRLGRFVAFSEMLTDLTPVQLFHKAQASRDESGNSLSRQHDAKRSG
jgi:hypothetical protein